MVGSIMEMLLLGKGCKSALLGVTVLLQIAMVGQWRISRQ